MTSLSSSIQKEEEQSNHPAEGSVNVVKGPHQILEEQQGVEFDDRELIR